MGFLTDPDDKPDSTPPRAERGEPGRHTAGERENVPRPAVLIVAALVLLAMVGTAIFLRSRDEGETDAPAAAGDGGDRTTDGGTGGVTCLPGEWPEGFDSAVAPPNEPDAAPGVYVWRNPETGWKVRITAEAAQDYKVTVATSTFFLPGTFTVVSPAVSTIDLGRTEATFTSHGDADVVGFDFSGCFVKEMRIDVRRGDTLIPAQDITVGASGEANTNPLIIGRAS
jgi:hypothetical protein